MTAPFYPTGAFGDEVGFLVILVLGFFFGFFLERAGFASARKLAGIFYFKDFAVLRVMFTAVIVCMVGLLYLKSLGWIVWDAVNVPATFLGAHIFGGLLLGVGFIVGGYCPGTSIVAAASGKLDALAYIGGVLFGTAIFGLSYDNIQPLYHWGERGVVYLSDFTGLSSGVLAVLIATIAIAAFAATEIADRKQQRPSAEGGKSWTLQLTWQRAAAALVLVLAFGLMSAQSIASVSGTKKLTELVSAGESILSPAELDQWIKRGDPVQLIDLRDAAAYARFHLPGAVNIPLEFISMAELSRDTPVVLYDEHGTRAGQAWALLVSADTRARILDDGVSGWRREVLREELPQDRRESTDPAVAPSPPPAAAPAIKIPVRRFKKGSSCS